MNLYARSRDYRLPYYDSRATIFFDVIKGGGGAQFVAGKEITFIRKKKL